MLQQVDERVCSRFVDDSSIDGPRKSAPSSPSRSSTNKTPTSTDIGKRVTFQSDKKEKSGRLRYFGSPEFAPGVWCGIELDEPVGKNNGSVSGIRYFSCPSNHGLFVPLGRVELDQTPIKPKKTSNRLKKIEPPFFYNTLPRSTSIPALHNLDITRSSTLTSPIRRPLPVNGVTDNRKVSSPQVPSIPSAGSNTRRTNLSGRFNKDTPGIRVNSSSSSLVGSKTKFASEVNISRKSKSTAETPLIAVVAPQKRFRKTLASCSNEFTPQDERGKENKTLSLKRNSNSCTNINQASAARGTSPNHRRGLSPNAANGIRGTSPLSSGGISPLRGTSPNSIYDSEVDSFCSSTSDWSHRSTSDSDPTPRSSSVSPDLDSAFILSTSGPQTVRILTSPDTSPVHNTITTSTNVANSNRISTTSKGLATVAGNLKESSRSNGIVGEYRGPSPEGLNNNRKFQNTQKGSRTLEHPLVNGQIAQLKKSEEDNGVFEEQNGYHGDSDRLDAMSSQLDACINQYAMMDGRVGDMELTLISFKKDVFSMLEEIKRTFQRQVNDIKLIHQKQLDELTRRHQSEIKSLLLQKQSSKHEAQSDEEDGTAV